ncbi:hypothetical protein IQ250_05970 [Pseudanabaenaceae cyanobacterium LEGE 13415]|nr:hypothetical protein [Pseudanabaenaceae cyanobacterium LEGE 13415]
MTSRATQFVKFAASIAVCSLGGLFVLSSPSFASEASLIAVDKPAATPDTTKPATTNTPAATPSVPNTPAATPTPAVPAPVAPVAPAAPATPVETTTPVAPAAPTTPAPVENAPATPTQTTPVTPAPATETAPVQPIRMMW